LQRAVSNHTTWSSQGLTICLTEVVFSKAKIEEVPVISAFLPYHPIFIKNARRTPFCDVQNYLTHLQNPLSKMQRS
jgi:hypothetical protein